MKKKSDSFNSNYTLNLLKLDADRKTEIEALKEEINSIKKINARDKDYLLLELQSKLDQFEYEQGNLLLESRQELIEKLNDENEHLKKQISDKEELNRHLSEIIADNERKINELENEITATKDELAIKDKAILENENELSKLSSNITELNQSKNKINKLLSDKYHENSNLEMKLTEKENIIADHENKITKLNELLADKDNENSNLVLKLTEKENIISNNVNKINEVNNSKFGLENEITKLNELLDNENSANSRLILNVKEEIENNNLEIEYLKNTNFTKRLLNPLSYVYLVLKSNPKEISINLKLYRAFKNSDYFDIGYYLKNNEDVWKSKWCRYFSPQLHYVCCGYDEKRKINRINLKMSKEELLDYIKNNSGAPTES